MVEEFLEVTVIICTRNRAKQLAAVLESAAAMRVPEGLQWEFLLVDNGSTDNTAEVAMAFADRLPMRVVREDTPGLSNARNKGVREARGHYLCWTDDDVVIDPGWLSAYVEAFRRHPEAAIFGGKVIPRLEGTAAPDWFVKGRYERPICYLLAYRDFGDAELLLRMETGQVPYGANFAVRTHEQRQFLYDPELGVSPSHKRLGEETDVIYRILHSGASGWWVPGSLVNHIIPPARQTAAYVYEYHYLAGATMAHIRSATPQRNHILLDGRQVEGYELRPWRLFRRGINRLLRYGLARLRGDEAWVGRLSEAGYFLGAAGYRSRYDSQLAGLKKWF